MPKLKLDLGALRVETFQADEERRQVGTVHANAATPACSGEESCQEFTWCQDTCYCANTSPRPSCDECSWDGCLTFTPGCA